VTELHPDKPFLSFSLTGINPDKLFLVGYLLRGQAGNIDVEQSSTGQVRTTF